MNYYKKEIKKRNKGHSSSTQYVIKNQFKPEHFIHKLNIELDLQSIFGLLCTAVLIGWDPAIPPLPPHLAHWLTLLVSQDRRHLYVTPWFHMSVNLTNEAVLGLLYYDNWNYNSKGVHCTFQCVCVWNEALLNSVRVHNYSKHRAPLLVRAASRFEFMSAKRPVRASTSLAKSLPDWLWAPKMTI